MQSHTSRLVCNLNQQHILTWGTADTKQRLRSQLIRSLILPAHPAVSSLTHTMKPSPGFSIGPEDYMFDEDSRELLEGMEGASVQEKLVDTEFFNRFEVSGTN